MSPASRRARKDAPVTLAKYKLQSNLKREVTSARRGGRVWHGHSRYDPAMFEKLLTILRVWYNYCTTIVGGARPRRRKSEPQKA